MQTALLRRERDCILGFAKDYLRFIRHHKLFCAGIGLTLVLAYGFYATHYTVHIDQLFQEYYNGNLLFSVGRWTTPVIHFLTNWMNFAPFWHTAVMAILLFLSAIAWTDLFSRASGGKISDTALFVFCCVFVSYPAIKAQLTYPILNIILSYVLVPISIRFLTEAVVQRSGRIKRILAALLFLIPAIDMYESFAAVFIVGVFATMLLLYLLHDGGTKKPSFYFRFALLAISLLFAAILADFAISKLLNLLICGTTEFWYVANTKIFWLSDNPARITVRLMLSLFVYFVIGSISVPFLATFTASALIGFAAILSVAIKRRSAVPVLLYLGMLTSVFALSIVVGRLSPIRELQTLPLFFAFSCMFLLQFCQGKRVLYCLASFLLFVLVFNQTKELNNYAVENYERYNYETALLEDVGNDLLQYDIQNKPTFFYTDDFHLPESLCHPREEEHPATRAYRNLMISILDRILPDVFFRKVNGYGYGTDYSTAGVAKSLDAQFMGYESFIQWAGNNHLERFMARLGYPLLTGSEQMKTDCKRLLSDNDPTCRYRIIETEEAVLVYFMNIE